METTKRMTAEEIKKWFKDNKPEVIKELKAIQDKDENEFTKLSTGEGLTSSFKYDKM